MLTTPPPADDLQSRLTARARAAHAALVHDLRSTPVWVRWAAAIWLGLGVAFVVFLMVFDWNWARGPVARIASAQLHRTVTIDGNLRVHPWSFTPTAEVEGLKIGQPDWAGPGQMATAARVAVQIEILPLLRGQVILPQLEIDQPNVVLLRQASGQANWTFGPPNKDASFKLPPIRHFVIDNGVLTLNDAKRGLTFNGHISSNERATGEGRGKFELVGDGVLNGARFIASITGGPLINISPDKPYPIAADVTAGSTHLIGSGQIDKPFDLGRYEAKLDVRGLDLNKLYDLTGLSLPNTPPYRIVGALIHQVHLYNLEGFTGHIGDSDVSGDLSVTTGGVRPVLTGAIASRRLDFKDLGSLVGMAPSGVKGGTVGQKVQAAANANGGFLLPNATLQVDRIRAMDADVSFRADAVNAPGWPLRKFAVDIGLKNGVMTLDPFSFSFSRGDLSGKIRLDASGAVPKTDADLRLANGRLEDFIPIKSDGKPGIEGVVAARIKLSGAGDSVHKAAAASNGAVTVVIPKGEIRQAFAELLGINASKGLILLLSHDNRETPLRCAVANFKVTNGVLQAQQVVFDTGVVLATGSGTVDLNNETMDLRLTGDSKKPRLVRLFAPITLKGPLTHPAVGVETGKIVAQGGFGLALGALLSPLATILPFVDVGLAKDADCVSLMADAQTAPAPVRTAATTPAKKP